MRLGMRSTVRVCDGLLIAGLVVAVVGVGVVLAALSGSDGSLESAPIVRLTLPPAITAACLSLCPHGSPATATALAVKRVSSLFRSSSQAK